MAAYPYTVGYWLTFHFGRWSITSTRTVCPGSNLATRVARVTPLLGQNRGHARLCVTLRPFECCTPCSVRPIKARRHEQAPLFDPCRVVDPQQCDRRPADRGLAHEDGAFPVEVFVPRVRT